MTTRLRHTSALAFGSAASGVLAYVFFAAVTRALGPVRAAPVSVLWAYWSFAGAALTFPLQHWVSRSVAAHGGELAVRTSLPGVARLGVVVALLGAAAAWLVRNPLFHDSRPWFPLLVGAVTLGSIFMGTVRGVLSARGRFNAVAVGLVAENGVRCLGTVVLMAAGVHFAVAFGLCLLAGYAAAAAWPSALRLVATGVPDHAHSPAAFLGGAAGSQLIGQVVLTGGPVLLALSGGASAEITGLFAVLALFRVPYILTLGMVAPLTGRLTALVVQRRSDSLRRLRWWLVTVALAAAAAAAGLAATVGPPLVRLVFGAGVSLPPGLTVLLAVGSTVAMANLVVTLVVLAQGRTPALVRAWSLALVPGVAWFVLAGGSALDRTCAVFLLVEASAFCLLLREEAHGTSRLDGPAVG